MQTLKEMPTEKLCSELDAAIARLHAERVRLRELLQRLVNNIESGESTDPKPKGRNCASRTHYAQ